MLAVLTLKDSEASLAPCVGLEPTTYRLTAGCSTIELTGHKWGLQFTPDCVHATPPCEQDTSTYTLEFLDLSLQPLTYRPSAISPQRFISAYQPYIIIISNFF